jgi:hypothetical protein
VRWDGYVVRVVLADDDGSPQSMYHAATVLVKMNSNDQEGVNGADLGLSMSEESLAQNKDTLSMLHTGDHIEFDATLQALGDSNHLHHLHSWSVSKLDGHLDVDLQVVDNGRYKLSHKEHNSDEE